MESAIAPTEVRRKNAELDAKSDRLLQGLADLPAVATLAKLPLSTEDLRSAWDEHGIGFQRSLIGLLIESVTVNPATRLAPGRFDVDRLKWRLRV